MKMLPNTIPKSIFKDLHKRVDKLMWRNRCYKIALVKLYLPVRNGGPAVQDFNL